MKIIVTFVTTLPIHPAFHSDNGVNGGEDDGVKQSENKLDKLLKIIYDGVNEIIGILLNVSGLNALEIATRINNSCYASS
ncbi:MAG: hypothetical protein LBP25_06500 [Tannerellaceae bacterium]|nr:hypothetical protein [Tannerellaceae bacterium]